MERYLCSRDYFVIQNSQLNQITQNNSSRLYQCELVAQGEISSYLVQRWNIDKEFTPTSPWSPTEIYAPGDRVTIDYPAFNPNSSYNFGDCVIYNSKGYVANTSIVPGSPAAFNPTEWDFIGLQYDIYNAKYPYPQFVVNNYYNLNDKVYWKGYTYNCAKETQPWDSESIIQYVTYSNVPLLNIFPDDPNSNDIGQYWNQKTPYSVPAWSSSPAGSLPTNTEYWTLGDNRCQQMVMYMTDITVYHLHKSIAPNNIPELRVHAYNAAKEWLKGVSKGVYTPIGLIPKEPTQGLKIRWGGQIKMNNDW